MKKLFYLFLISLYMGALSCSSDDDNDKNTALESNFVGFWHQDAVDENEKYNYLFQNDGTIYKYTTSWYGEGTTVKKGNWKYDNTTKLLTTTIDGTQWIITLKLENSWTGLNGGKGESYVRATDCYLYSRYLNGQYGDFRFVVMGTSFSKDVNYNDSVIRTDYSYYYMYGCYGLNNNIEIKKMMDFYRLEYNASLKEKLVFDNFIFSENQIQADCTQTFYINDNTPITFFKGTITFQNMFSDTLTLKAVGKIDPHNAFGSFKEYNYTAQKNVN